MICGHHLSQSTHTKHFAQDFADRSPRDRRRTVGAPFRTCSCAGITRSLPHGNELFLSHCQTTSLSVLGPRIHVEMKRERPEDEECPPHRRSPKRCRLSSVSFRFQRSSVGPSYYSRLGAVVGAAGTSTGERLLPVQRVMGPRPQNTALRRARGKGRRRRRTVACVSV